MFSNPFNRPENPRRHKSRPTFTPRVEELERRDVPTTLPAGFTETNVVSGLTGPSNMEFSPDGRLFVLEQTGRVKLVHDDGTTFTSLRLRVDSRGERGLLGIAFHPNYADNHFVYLYYTNPVAGGKATKVHNQVSRFTVDDTNPRQPVFTSETPIFDLNNLGRPALHNGGSIHFGADGMLYVGVGDNRTAANAQKLTNLFGKMLRVDVDGFTGVRDDTTVGNIIPADNPFVGQTVGLTPLIWALGLRNPYTFAVQPGTGTIYINDVGQAAFEEINVGVAGANYGWPRSEGFKRPNNAATTIGTYHDPLLAYNHQIGPTGGAAIVGGVFYNPAAPQFPSEFVGRYFFEDLVSGWIRVFDPTMPGSLAAPNPSTSFATKTGGFTVALSVDPVGNLFYLSITKGQVKKISFVG